MTLSVEHTTTISIPTLTTERFVMRAPQASDLDAYAEFCASGRSVGVGGPYSRAKSFARLGELVGHWQLRGYGRWMVADRQTNAPCGVVGVMYPDDWPEPEIAWTVFGSAEGKGVAYETALMARRYAYEVLKWSSAISCVMTGNDRSETLAKRLGATFERVFDHPEYGPMNVWRHPSREALS